MVAVAEGFSPTAGRQRAKALGYIYKGRLRGLIPELIIKHHNEGLHLRVQALRITRLYYCS